jgi:hypothetical protein
MCNVFTSISVNHGKENIKQREKCVWLMKMKGERWRMAKEKDEDEWETFSIPLFSIVRERKCMRMRMKTRSGDF